MNGNCNEEEPGSNSASFDSQVECSFHQTQTASEITFVVVVEGLDERKQYKEPGGRRELRKVSLS